MEIKVEDIIAIAKEEVQNTAISFEELEADQNLTDQGFDSLDFNTFLLGIEEKYDVEISDEEVASLKTINDIIAFVHSKQ